MKKLLPLKLKVCADLETAVTIGKFPVFDCSYWHFVLSVFEQAITFGLLFPICSSTGVAAAMVFAFVWHLMKPYSSIMTDSQMELHLPLVQEMTRSTSAVSTPTPGALAVIREPAKDPSFVSREVNVGVIVSPYATTAPPAGAPSSKYILISISSRLVTFVSVNTASVADFDFVTCFYVLTHSSVDDISPLKPVPATTTSCVPDAASN